MKNNHPNATYWDHKLAAYLHDPFDKAFAIKGHEERAAQLLEIFGLDLPNEKYWKKADGIASGFERGQVPTYSEDKNKNGAVNFVNNGEAILTHPIGDEAKLKINLSQVNAESIHENLKKYLGELFGIDAGRGGYSKYFPNDPDKFAQARFIYAHLALRFKLAEDNIANLGALWHRLPADTRFPDHSIWQHNALTSALTSCMELAGDEDSIGLMVFSITPVQGFIANARKLRDYWTGSVILSWLAFEGLRWVIENLGPDHVLYPSLIDQPLINEYLEKEWHISDVKTLTKVRDIASLPNKFVVLIPLTKGKQIGVSIQNAISKAWQNLVKNVEEFIIAKAQVRNPEEIDFLTDLIKEQTSTFWDLQWAAVKLVAGEDTNELQKLLPQVAYTNQLKLLEILNRIIAGRHYQNSGKGALYSVSHQLVQSALASQKMQRKNKRPPQNGEKCSMCGEFEVMHSKKHTEGQSASTYKSNIIEFWKEMRGTDEDTPELRKNEKLCAICFTKRMAYRVIKEKMPDHILNSTFKNAERFPSTTQIALHKWFERNDIKDKKQQKDIADKLHDVEDNSNENKILQSYFKPTDNDKYFAILMMDGDHMGKMINGETIAATWKSIMHPLIYQRLNDHNFNDLFYSNWAEIFSKYPKRFITPSIHATISEALADFSIYGVRPIVEKYHGKLIYAGGDDVCAILPWQNVVQAAHEIRDFFISNYKLINDNEPKNISIETEWTLETGKLSVLMGEGKNISLSAGIVIGHHKENLSHLIKRAQELLKNKAKKEGGRNALAIELKKRSGGSRYFVAHWDDEKSTTWDKFQKLQIALSKSSKDISRSLLYRLSKFEEGAIPLIKRKNKKMMMQFIQTLLEKSELSNKDNGKADKVELAQYISELISEKIDKNGQSRLDNDALIIAAFLAQKEA